MEIKDKDKDKDKVAGAGGFRFWAPVGLALALLAFGAQAGAKSSLEGYDRPMRSRVCGLVLLSEGRAETRAAKSAASQDKASASMGRLVKAFSLLADGRQTDLNAARESARTLLGTIPKPAAEKPVAIAWCEAWLATRYPQADFDKSESARWSWASQAKLTFETE